MSKAWSKTCPTCHQSFGRSGFYSDSTRPGGVAYSCKECHKARMKAYWADYYPEHKEELVRKVLLRRHAHAEELKQEGEAIP